jgi:endo-beta-N-acetylglucosaminidase D
MSKEKNKSNCIICGMPSETVVCVRCFFSYDHRTYNNRELEKKKKNKEPEQNYHENNYHDDDDINNWSSQNHLDSFVNEEMQPIPQERIANTSWISRLPRFS